VTEPQAEPKAAIARPDVLRSELRAVGLERGITSIRRLSGGYVADAWLVTYADGTRVAAKGSHNNYFGSSGRVAGSADVARIV
jgi:hypothetical protein